MVEKIVDEKGRDRLRASGSKLKKYLREKRPRENDIERITTYRTAACLACNIASSDDAPELLVDELRAELEWAMSRLKALAPSIFNFFTNV